MELLKISIDDFGGAPYCVHNYPCPVYRERYAVLIMENGYFQPSWKAQSEGWKLVKADTIIKRFLLRMFFKKEHELFPS